MSLMLTADIHHQSSLSKRTYHVLNEDSTGRNTMKIGALVVKEHGYVLYKN
jgi:hypothetical protein